MNLKKSRDKWRDNFLAGNKLDNRFMRDYRRYRDSEEWRSTRLMEEMAEYILFLEKINENK